ncbi:MAG: ABC transporter ATP-binding protein [Candidatus Omnitrophica bacterium]|nr:ABC transporter ATP-binding protein [Candidatus Omnitrophota bacterium]
MDFMGSLLEIQNLKVKFYLDRHVITAVQGVNLELRAGETLVLAGESGSGKSVTALAVTRILPVNARVFSGKVIFKGRDLLSLDESSLSGVRGKEIAYIFQEPSGALNPVYTVGNQLIEPFILHQGKSPGQARREAEFLLSLVKIGDVKRVMESYPHQLSGGMNQRVFIAMSLACNPQILIADEPTTALDVTIEAEILKLLVELKKKIGFSLLFITHNLSIARRIAGRVCVMYKGSVVEEGGIEDIFNSPKHFHTRDLVSAYEKIGKI